MGGVSCASVLSHPTYFLPMEVQDGASTDTGSRVAVPRAGGDARIGVKAEDLGYRKSSNKDRLITKPKSLSPRR